MTPVEVTTERRAFFTVAALADYLQVSERYVRQLCLDGKLPSYKLGTARRIAAEDVDSWLESQRERRAA